MYEYVFKFLKLVSKLFIIFGFTSITFPFTLGKGNSLLGSTNSSSKRGKKSTSKSVKLNI